MHNRRCTCLWLPPSSTLHACSDTFHCYLFALKTSTMAMACSADYLFHAAKPDLTLAICHVVVVVIVVVYSSCAINSRLIFDNTRECAILMTTEQALASPQALQNYYAQLYGLTTSPSAAAAPYHHQYLGYMAPSPPTPRMILTPPPPPAAQQVTAVQPLVQHPPPAAQQVTVQPLPLLQHPPPQIHAPFFPAPSLPQHNFRLHPPPPPPPQAMAVLPPNTTGAYVACLFSPICVLAVADACICY
jgi:hypothetical protein